MRFNTNSLGVIVFVELGRLDCCCFEVLAYPSREDSIEELRCKFRRFQVVTLTLMRNVKVCSAPALANKLMMQDIVILSESNRILCDFSDRIPHWGAR